MAGQPDPEPPRRGWLKRTIGIDSWAELLLFVFPLVMVGGLCALLASLGRALTDAYLPGWGWRVGAYVLAALLAVGLFAYAGIKERSRISGWIFLAMPFGMVWLVFKVFDALGAGVTWISQRVAPAAPAWLPLLVPILPLAAFVLFLNRSVAARLTEQVEPATIAAATKGALAELKPHLRPGDEIWCWETPKWTWDALMGRGGYVIVRDGKPTKHSVMVWMN
ncbi:MAG TPA: hypothetical protein VD886_26510 [Herpetosiphonaceae bacterium]|nr:hypothetical protein [Herpetosiphonaceae bacterium]